MSNMKDFDIKDGVLVKYTGNEEHVAIPDSVTSIGENVFYGCENPVISTCAGSYAEEYAKENEIKVSLI